MLPDAIFLFAKAGNSMLPPIDMRIIPPKHPVLPANVSGLMPHPERACEPLLGSDDGKWIFESIFAALKNKTVAAAA